MNASKAVMLAALVALGLTTTGCFTTWVGLRASGRPGAPDERVHIERVPLAGVQERLVVVLEGNRFQCTGRQHASDHVYRSAYRYGKGWKIATVGMFVTEALVATAIYFDKPGDPAHLVGAGYFALDALGTAALSFVPRRQVGSDEVVPISTTIREVCPEGLVLQINSESYPIDATGSVGDLGTAALEDSMRGANGSMQDASLLIDFQGRTAPLRSDTMVRAATFDLPAGTLAQVALP
jgi:hypothetical protein